MRRCNAVDEEAAVNGGLDLSGSDVEDGERSLGRAEIEADLRGLGGIGIGDEICAGYAEGERGAADGCGFRRDGADGGDGIGGRIDEESERVGEAVLSGAGEGAEGLDEIGAGFGDEVGGNGGGEG